MIIYLLCAFGPVERLLMRRIEPPRLGVLLFFWLFRSVPFVAAPSVPLSILRC